MDVEIGLETKYVTRGRAALDRGGIITSPLAFPNFFFNVDEIYQQRWLEESGQSQDNVNQIHLVLDSGKLVLQKIIKSY